MLVSGCAANQYSEIACVFSKILKKQCAVRVNETKVASRNAFIVYVFALESEK